MAGVQQTQKMIPFITCEISLCQYVCELILGVTVFDLDLGVQNSIKQPIMSNSVGSGNFSPLITASLSSITYNKASSREELTLEEKSTLSRSSIFP